MKADRFAKYTYLAAPPPKKQKRGETGAASAGPSLSDSFVTDSHDAPVVAPGKIQVQQVQQAMQQREPAAPAAPTAKPGATFENLKCEIQSQGVSQLAAPAAHLAPQKGQSGDDADLTFIKHLTFDADDWAYDPIPETDP